MQLSLLVWESTCTFRCWKTSTNKTFETDALAKGQLVRRVQEQ